MKQLYFVNVSPFESPRGMVARHGQFKTAHSVCEHSAAKRSMLISALSQHALITLCIYSKAHCPVGPGISMQMKGGELSLLSSGAW